MEIVITKETQDAEKRIPITPATAEKLIKLGCNCHVESNLGQELHYSDEDYKKVGATIFSDRKKALSTADAYLRLSPPSVEDVRLMKEKAFLIGFLDPFTKKDLLKTLQEKNITSISMELMPRTTIAQKMDALSSQANLAGYIAVIMATEKLDQVIPMMTTPAGTLFPAKVFIIGVGVAGLQAIATAKRLGARVEAYDTRPIVKEQVESLGAKFFQIDLGDTGETQQGYAKELSKEQLVKQKEAMLKAIAGSDIVITTAQLLGKPAPLLVTDEMVNAMKAGSVIVDMATLNGGNVAGSKKDEVIVKNGVTIIGYSQLARFTPLSASEMYGSNLYNLIHHFWDKEKKAFPRDWEEEFFQNTLLTQNGKIVNKWLLQQKQGE